MRITNILSQKCQTRKENQFLLNAKYVFGKKLKNQINTFLKRNRMCQGKFNMFIKSTTFSYELK
jgi:hypothetical protein